MSPADFEATVLLRVIARHTGQLAGLAGEEHVARRLANVPINLATLCTCITRELRVADPILLGAWTVARLAPSPAGRAYAALQLARSAVASALAEKDRALGWLGELERRLAGELRRVGQVPAGSAEVERRVLRQHGDVEGDGER